MSDHFEWQVKNDCCWFVEGPIIDAKRQIEEALYEEYSKDWRVTNIDIGRRLNRGVYSYYRVTYWMHPRHGYIGGSNEVMFQFSNDLIDASAQSASL